MKKVKVEFKSEKADSYTINMGKNLFPKIPQLLPKASSVFIICDSHTKKLFGNKLLNSLKKSGKNAFLLSFPAGEKHKTPETIVTLCRQLLAKGADRKSLVIALGGGVAGDVAGIAAATFMRGISFVQIPTTLLAMVDSSIGGKVGVDLPEGKNSFGAFKQPAAVFSDISLLKKLPESEMKNGLAEIVKTAMIADAKLFTLIEKEGITDKNLIKIIKRCCEIKANTVVKDEREQNLRRILNYGHTIGHAIEVMQNYSIPHGRAVAIGMLFEGKLANRIGLLSDSDLARQDSLIKKLKLSGKIPNINPAKLIKIMKHDKKAVSGKIIFALPERVGKMHSIRGIYGIHIPERVIKSVLQ